MEGKGKVGDKGLRKEERRRLFQELEAMGKAGDKGEGKVGDKGKGNEAVTATVRPKKGLGKKAVTAKLQQGKGKVGDKGMGKKELTARVKDDWGNYLIEVRINKLETIPMISYEL